MVPFTALFADVDGLTDHDLAELAKDGLAPAQPSHTDAIHGFISRHGETIPFTLDTANFVREPRRTLPEHCAIGALILASFIPPIYHLLG